jgi:pimeloyl-ACP methyl ester carboxylesterase
MGEWRGRMYVRPLFASLSTSLRAMVPSIYKSLAGKEAVLRWYETQVASLPLAVERLDLDTPSGHTHVLAAGAAEAAPVVVLHGMNMNAAAMTEAIRSLAGNHRVYAVDIIGMPGKSTGTRLPRRGERYPQWLETVLMELGLESAAFVGVSFGGWLVLKLAALSPGRVRAAALLDTGGLVPFTLRGQALAGFAALRYMLRPTLANALRAAKPFFGPATEPEPTFAEILALGYRHTRLDIDPKGLPALGAGELSRFRGPCFVSFGAKDVFFNAKQAVERARAVLPCLVTAEVVAGEGHVRSLEAEQTLYQRVGTFLGSHAA